MTSIGTYYKVKMATNHAHLNQPFSIQDDGTLICNVTGRYIIAGSVNSTPVSTSSIYNDITVKIVWDSATVITNISTHNDNGSTNVMNCIYAFSRYLRKNEVFTIYIATHLYKLSSAYVYINFFKTF